MLSPFVFAKAQSDSLTAEDELREILKMDSIIRSFHYQTGKVQIGKNLATLQVPQGCLFIETAEARFLMENVYRNPENPSLLGIMLSDTPSIFSDLKWLVEYNYEETGHVNDDDAEDINYDDLLKEIRKGNEEGNLQRKALGLPTSKLIGWAQKPFYDQKNKKLHWAKEFKFEGSETNTLNYEIRVLGRQGVLSMNIISDMTKLKDVNADVNKIIGSTNFNQGNTYAEFNEDTDKIAEYGIAGLIAGGILAKTGLLAKIGIFLLKFIKPLIVGVIALFAFIGKKLFGKGKQAQETQLPNDQNQQN